VEKECVELGFFQVWAMEQVSGEISYVETVQLMQKLKDSFEMHTADRKAFSAP